MSVACMGEMLIDFVAQQTGVSVGDADSFKKAAGGAPANVAVAVARLGHKSAFIGMVGDDPFGHFLKATLDAEGVDTRGVKFNSKARTMLAFVSRRADGERNFSFYRHPSADMKMRPEDVDTRVIDAMQIFHFGSITLINQPARSATLAAADHARTHDKLISYDPNMRLNLWSSARACRQGMLRGFEYAHIVKVSDEEVVFLTGSDDVTPLWRDQTRAIVVTQGRRGSTVYLKEGKVHLHVEGQAVETVDTTGAGDAFLAGLLHGLLIRGGHSALYEDLSEWGEILHVANSVGALVTTQYGAIPAMPTRERAELLAASAG